MGKTLEELFKSKKLPDGKTAAEKYEIRDAKDMLLRSSTGAMDLPFKVAQIARRNISARLSETRLEEETTGLRIIAKAGAPVIYGTDIFKLTTQKTEMVTAMKDSVNPNNSADNGLLGNLFNKGKEIGLKFASKLGIQFPQKLIPTKISLNSDFKAGKEPDTMVTLAKIKGDSAGNLVGKLLAQNAKGTPKQIGNQLLGAGIDLLKTEIKKKLIGAPKQGAQNFAKKSIAEVQYDSKGKYSDTVQPDNDDYFKRNDLSSILVAQETKALGGGPAVSKKIDELVPKAKNLINVPNNPFADIKDKVSDIKDKATAQLAGAKKDGQQAIADGKTKIGDTNPTNPGKTVTYSSTIDATQDDTALRNDLTSKLESFQKASADLASKGGNQLGISRNDVATNAYSTLKNSENPSKTLKIKYGIESSENLDLLNEKTPYVGTITLADGTTLDEADFITLKFKSLSTGKTVNFRATISGVSETVSPSWDSAKFIGSPFHYYTYTGVERSLQFNFKVYSTTPTQHIAAWHRLNFLTSLAYPQGYANSIGTIAPFIQFTLGNLYKEKTCIIESLGYTVDDNTPWHVGFTGASGLADNTKFNINNQEFSADNYKLPKIIDVAVTVKLVESKGTTLGGNFYGYTAAATVAKSGDAPKKQDGNSSNAQTSTDANNKGVTTSTSEANNQATKDDKNLTQSTTQNSPSATGASANATETKAAAAAPKPPQYQFIVEDMRIFANGKDEYRASVWADGTRILYRYFSTLAYNKDTVEKALKGEAGISGFTGENGKQYAPNPIFK